MKHGQSQSVADGKLKNEQRDSTIEPETESDGPSEIPEDAADNRRATKYAEKSSHMADTVLEKGKDAKGSGTSKSG